MFFLNGGCAVTVKTYKSQVIGVVCIGLVSVCIFTSLHRVSFVKHEDNFCATVNSNHFVI